MWLLKLFCAAFLLAVQLNRAQTVCAFEGQQGFTPDNFLLIGFYLDFWNKVQQFMLAWYLWQSSCFRLPSAGIIGMSYHTQFWLVIYLN